MCFNRSIQYLLACGPNGYMTSCIFCTLLSSPLPAAAFQLDARRDLCKSDWEERSRSGDDASRVAVQILHALLGLVRSAVQVNRASP